MKWVPDYHQTAGIRGYFSGNFQPLSPSDEGK